MRKNQLGTSGIYVSELTLGCMSLGTNPSVAKEIIDSAINAGINHLDTADLYNFGDNEKIIGAAIKDKRSQIVLTTKVGNHFNANKKDWFWDPSKKHIEQAVKKSLHRLQTDYLDFYMLHGGTLDDPIDETIDAFERLKKEGVIRAYGISSIRPSVIREYVKRSTIDAVMMQYSLLDRRPEEEILDLLHENKISVLARGPLAKGMLSNKAEININAKGQAGFLNHTHDDLSAMYKNLSEKFTEEFPLNVLALKYVLKHPAVATAVFGASSVAQIKENTNFDYSNPLPTNIYEGLQQNAKPNYYTNHR